MSSLGELLQYASMIQQANTPQMPQADPFVQALASGISGYSSAWKERMSPDAQLKRADTALKIATIKDMQDRSAMVNNLLNSGMNNSIGTQPYQQDKSNGGKLVSLFEQTRPTFALDMSPVKGTQTPTKYGEVPGMGPSQKTGAPSWYGYDIVPEYDEKTGFSFKFKNDGSKPVFLYDKKTGKFYHSDLTPILNPNEEIPKAREIKEYTPGEDPMATVEKLRLTSTMRKEYTDIIKDFPIVRTQFQYMETSLNHALKAKDEKSKAAADQALVVAFNKMIDPTSVVRESEYARTGEGQSAIAQIQGFVEKLKQGGSGLTDENRRDVVAVARKLYDAAENYYNLQTKNYRDLAIDSGLKPDLIIGRQTDMNNPGKLRLPPYKPIPEPVKPVKESKKRYTITPLE